jgi:hypothetical protein
MFLVQHCNSSLISKKRLSGPSRAPASSSRVRRDRRRPRPEASGNASSRPPRGPADEGHGPRLTVSGCLVRSPSSSENRGRLYRPFIYETARIRSRPSCLPRPTRGTRRHRGAGEQERRPAHGARNRGKGARAIGAARDEHPTAPVGRIMHHVPFLVAPLPLRPFMQSCYSSSVCLQVRAGTGAGGPSSPLSGSSSGERGRTAGPASPVSWRRRPAVRNASRLHVNMDRIVCCS